MPEKTEIGSAMIPADTEALDAFKSGVAEANRRERGDFDGLLGQFDPTSSELLRDILSDLRDYLLDHAKDDDQARALLVEHKARSGFRWVTPIPDDIALVLRLLNSIRNAASCDAKKFEELVLGIGGARDKKRQVGASEGGVAAGEVRKAGAAIRHNEWIATAKKLLETGTAKSGLVAVVAKRHAVTAAAVRPVLQASSIITKRVRKKKVK